jgi:hypothetical protein
VASAVSRLGRSLDSLTSVQARLEAAQVKFFGDPKHRIATRQKTY